MSYLPDATANIAKRLPKSPLASQVSTYQRYKLWGDAKVTVPTNQRMAAAKKLGEMSRKNSKLIDSNNPMYFIRGIK